MSEYSYHDMKSIFEFAQTNPNSNIDEWFKMNSHILTKEEEKNYDGVYYDKIEMEFENKKYDFYFIKSNQLDTLEKITTKLVGNTGYYEFIPVGGYGYYYTIIGIGVQDFFHVDRWENYKDEFKGVKSITNIEKDVLITYDYWFDEKDDFKISCYSNHKEQLQNNNYAFWHTTSDLMVYIGKDSILMTEKLNPIKDLFKILERDFKIEKVIN